jgi:hypothetical protein
MKGRRAGEVLAYFRDGAPDNRDFGADTGSGCVGLSDDGEAGPKDTPEMGDRHILKKPL